MSGYATGLPPVPMYIAGAEVERMYAFGPTIGTAFNVTLISHVGNCCVGINADTAAVPDLPVLKDSLAEGFRTVLDMATAHPAEDTTAAGADPAEPACCRTERQPTVTGRSEPL